MSIFFLLLAFMVIFYLFVLRPQQRAEKKKKEMLGSVKKGWRVITAGGIRGTVAKVHDREKILTVTIAKGVDIEVALAKIEAAAPPGEELAVGEPARKEDKGKEAKEPRRPRR